MEIKSHKAADIVSYIKNLQKRGVSEREFKVRERERLYIYIVLANILSIFWAFF